MTVGGMSSNDRTLTLEEIGRQAGVSRSTVSRVLNDHPDVRPEVRARVEAVIDETGYVPNRAARALVSNRTGLIGLVMLTEVDELFGDPYYSALVLGIQQGCVERGLILSIFPVDAPEGRSDVLTTQIAQGFVDGVVVTAGPRSDRLIAALRDRRTPLVVVGHPADDRDVVRVDVENRTGSAVAVKHLHAHGRRRIGFIGTTPEHMFGVERLEGYRDALGDAGLAFDERLICLDEMTADGGYRAALKILDQGPDALHVATDTMAEGAVRALTERGIAIPDDLALVGFDGLPRGPRIEPALTTVVQPVVEVGRAAVALLSGEGNGSTVVVLPTTLRRGASCGCAPGRAAPESIQVVAGDSGVSHDILDRGPAQR